MNNEKKNMQGVGNYNWKGVMDFIKDEVKSSNTEWSQEKNLLVVNFIFN
jgi:hypothetical protein